MIAWLLPGGMVIAMRTAATTALVLAVAVLATACGRSEVPEAPPQQPAPPAAAPEPPPETISDVIAESPVAGSFSFEAYAYECGGMPVTVRPGADEITLQLPERSMTLPQVEAASGAKYAAGDDAFWGKGINSAALTLAGETIECELNRRETPWVDARARGAVFRGFGQEPGWHLEIHPERIVMVYRYGEERAVTPNPGALVDPDQPLRRWQATTEAHELAVEVEDRGCTDVMSGDMFPATVRVRLDGVAYSGCGRDLE